MSDQWAENEPQPPIDYAEIDKAIEQKYETNCWWACGYLFLISGLIGAIVFGFVIFDDLVMIHG